MPRKEGQRGQGGLAPKKRTCWPPRLYKIEQKDIEDRSVGSQTKNPTTSAECQTHKSTSDQQFQAAPDTKDRTQQANFYYETKLCDKAKCKCDCAGFDN